MKAIIGVTMKEDINKTLKFGMDHPMGPLQLGESGIQEAHWKLVKLLVFFHSEDIID